MPPLAWEALLSAAVGVFTAPTFALFQRIATGWVLCPGRHTVTGLLPTADPDRRRAHDSYHFFFRDAVWNAAKLWCTLARLLLLPTARLFRFALHPSSTDQAPVLQVLFDDTITPKTGRQVNGAGSFRDPVRSTAKRVAFTWGLNAVLLCICCASPAALSPSPSLSTSASFTRAAPRASNWPPSCSPT